MSKFSTTNNGTVNNSQFIQGDGAKAELHVHDRFESQAIEPEALGSVVAESLPPEVPEPERVDIQQELQTLAAMPIAQQEEPSNASRITALIGKLEPWGKHVRDGLWTFGAASLEAFASSNPIMAGLLALCKRFDKESQKESG